jgi:hypothetical protein
VLKGTLTSEGFHVEPNGVMAKCPSKYEPKAGGAKYEPKAGGGKYEPAPGGATPRGGI